MISRTSWFRLCLLAKLHHHEKHEDIFQQFGSTKTGLRSTKGESTVAFANVHEYEDKKHIASIRAADDALVLIAPLTTKMAGMNLQHHCCNGLLLNQGANLASPYQALFRGHRLGSEAVQFVKRYHSSETQMAEIENKLIAKTASMEMVSYDVTFVEGQGREVK